MNKTESFSILHRSIKYDKRLKPSVKIFYSDLLSYSNRRGYCSATNGHFAELYDVSPVTVSRWVKELKSLGFIKSEIEYVKGDVKSTVRKIYVNYEGHKGDNKIDTRGSNINAKSDLNVNDEQITYRKNYTIRNSISELKELIDNDSLLKEKTKGRFKLNDEEFDRCLNGFIDHVSSSESRLKFTLNKSEIEIKEWFRNWLNKQDVSRIKGKKRQEISHIVDWYLVVYNSISGRNFRNKDGLEEGLRKILDSGYKSEELILAVKNLYRQDEKNEFHRKNGYKYVTPQFLLKDNNMDKYLNLFPDRLRKMQKMSSKEDRIHYAQR
jgi:hypothetical protein